VRILHVLRKPLSEGTVAANTLKHGTGGLNINASRIASDGSHMVTRDPKRKQHDLSGGDRDSAGAGMFAAGSTFTPTNHKGGRWPANVILQHIDGCRCDGVKRVKPPNGSGVARRDGAKTPNTVYAGGWKQENLTGTMTYTDEDGKETVANWICEPGCPVARLDANSLAGGMHSAGNAKPHDRDRGTCQVTSFTGGQANTNGGRFGDKGGASRFYKQVGGKTHE
jgi:hypothetical protein